MRLNNSIQSVSVAGWVLAVSAIVSAFLGLLRNRFLLDVYGVSIETDIYNTAFRVPDLVYTLTLSGAISIALVPVLVSHFANNKEEAWHITQSFFIIAMMGVAGLAVVAFFAMPYAVDVLAVGFDEDARSKTVLLSRIMLISPILFGMSAVFGGILQSTRKFITYALAPLCYNIGIIIGVVFFTDIWGLNGLAYGVVLGAVLHIAIQVPGALSAGFRFKRGRKVFHSKIKHIIKLMAPRSFAASVHQINFMVATPLASVVSTGAITVFTNAYNLDMLLASILGISFATALFPTLSGDIVKKDYKAYLRHFSATFRGVLFLVLPASVLFVLLRTHIIRIIYGVEDIGWNDIQLMAASLALLSLGAVAYTLLPLLGRTFYARENTITPVIAGVLGVVVNIVCSTLLLFVIFPQTGFLGWIEGILGVQGVEATKVLALPLAFSLAGISSLCLLLGMFFISDVRNRSLITPIRNAFLRIAGLTTCVFLSAYALLQMFESDISNASLGEVMLQTGVVCTVSGVIYFGIALLLKFPEIGIIKVIHLKR